jgi:hypothetical protein
MAKEIEKVSVNEITIYRTVNNKIAVKRSDRVRPSRYFNTAKEARNYVESHFEGNVTETL